MSLNQNQTQLNSTMFGNYPMKRGDATVLLLFLKRKKGTYANISGKL